MVSNIDTIYVLIDIENYENSSKNILENLLNEKENLQLYLNENPTYKHIININNMNFELLSIGAKGFAYIIRNNNYEIKIAQHKSKLKSYTPIQVRISSECLWANGLTNSWGIIYNWIVETFGNVITEKVSRLDICLHTPDIGFTSNYEISYKGLFRKKQIFHTGNNINAITFGTRTGKNIYCRIYNKTLEIQEKNHKLWFKEIWQNNNMSIDNVWNIEFEIKSEFLRKYSIVNVNDIILHLKDLWKYCTNKWLVKIIKDNSKVERCSINSNWLEIQKAFDKFNSVGLIKRDKQNEFDAIKLVPNIIGNITSYSANKKILNIDKAFLSLKKDSQRYFDNKNTDFEREVTQKNLIK